VILPAGPEEVARRLAKRSRREPSGCVVWFGAKQTNGYGSVSIGAGKTALAHRAAYFIARGEIDPSLTIDHLCRNRLCVNPEHLEQVTCRENNRRGFGFSGVNARKTHCDAGHELAGDNLIVKARGNRNCRECQRIHERATQRRYAERLTAARSALAGAAQ
jgi:hypothetical protein